MFVIIYKANPTNGSAVHIIAEPDPWVNRYELIFVE